MAEKQDPRKTYAKRDSHTSIFHISLGGSAVKVSPESVRTDSTELRDTYAAGDNTYGDDIEYNDDIEYMTTMSNLDMPAVISARDVVEGEMAAESNKADADIRSIPSVEVPENSESGRRKSTANRVKLVLDTKGIEGASGVDEEEEENRSGSPKVKLEKPHGKDKISDVIIAYWKQSTRETAQYRSTPTRQQVKDYVESILSVSTIV